MSWLDKLLGIDEANCGCTACSLARLLDFHKFHKERTKKDLEIRLLKNKISELGEKKTDEQI